MLKEALLSCIVYCTVAKLMTKAAFKDFTTQIARKRREVSRLQEDLRDMLDHLTVIEARAKAAGGKRYPTAEVKKALGI
jgi:hypothetical protein